MCDEFEYDLERADVFRDTPRTARKQHQCSCCGGTIRPGFSYIEHFSCSSDGVNYEKMCSGCNDTMNVFAISHGRCNPSALYDRISECIGYDGDKKKDKWLNNLLDAIRYSGKF